MLEKTSPDPFDPESINEGDSTTRRDEKKKYKQYPGGLTTEEWRKRLAMAPEDVIRKTFEATTQLAMSVEAENRLVPRQHYKSRFPSLREKRVKYDFYSDTFFPSVTTNNNETCSQIFLDEIRTTCSLNRFVPNLMHLLFCKILGEKSESLRA